LWPTIHMFMFCSGAVLSPEEGRAALPPALMHGRQRPLHNEQPASIGLFLSNSVLGYNTRCGCR
jgi:hypothetical protein